MSGDEKQARAFFEDVRKLMSPDKQDSRSELSVRTGSAIWRPIETAPTNGCEIIAAGTNYGDIKQGYHIVITKHDGVGWLMNDNTDSEDYYPYLTHWMPLPEPPNK